MENNVSDFSSQSRGDGIELARDRDGSTLGGNTLTYADALYNLAYYLARNEADAEDLVQPWSSSLHTWVSCGGTSSGER